MNWKERIVSDETVLFGKPIIKDTRLSVEFLLDRFADDWTEEMLLENYPQLTKDDLQAALIYEWYEENGSKLLLKNAMIAHMRDFLLEFGNGFSFVAQQGSIVIEDAGGGANEYKIDLVFYNRLLQCFVLFDGVTHKITHQDIGEIQVYVHHYDHHVKLYHENPTIGVSLYADKNDAMVRYTLPENSSQIFASKCQFYLPTEAQLIAEIKKELDRFNQQ